ncbi:MAG: hypothetical protein ABSF62_20610 [Bryobacteraceae bacterium]
MADHPDLLGEDGGQPIAFVSSQVNLPDAGRLDLLFVTNEGLPIAVEVKLARNGESRREVIAQAIDYLSSLTSMTVDELDNLVGNSLDKALHGFASDDDEFEEMWANVGRNLRDGHAKLLVVLDTAPLALERIFRFLAHSSNLDVQLLTVQRYSDQAGREVLVPRLLVNPASEDPPGRASSPVVQKSMEELLAACANKVAIEFFKERSNMPMNNHKNALAYRQAGKVHWSVEPRRTGAAVIQMDRFEGDEATWGQGLSNPNITRLRYGANLRFDLTSSPDFEFFRQIAENDAPTLPWVKPQAEDRVSAGSVSRPSDP